MTKIPPFEINHGWMDINFPSHKKTGKSLRQTN